MTRTQERKDFDSDVRTALLESDMDKDDREKRQIRDELKSMSKVLTGILVAVATAAIMLAVNVILQGVGG